MQTLIVIALLVMIVVVVSSRNRAQAEKERTSQADKHRKEEEICRASTHKLSDRNFIYEVDFQSMRCSFIEWIQDVTDSDGTWRNNYKLYRTIEQEWFVQLVERHNHKPFGDKIYPPRSTPSEKEEELARYIEDRELCGLPPMTQNEIAEYKSLVEEIGTKQRWEKLYRCAHFEKGRPPKAVWLDGCYRGFTDYAESHGVDAPRSTTDMDNAVRHSNQERIDLNKTMFEFRDKKKLAVCGCCGLPAAIETGTLCRHCLKGAA